MPALSKEELIELIQKADEGDANSQFNLGALYERGESGLTKDDVKAKEYYERAVQQNNPSAQNNLRLLLEREVANDEDHPKASTLLRLGTIYYFGEGITKDAKKARGFYERAAEMNNATAQAALGFMHQYGEGDLPINLNEAARLYWLAAAQNNAAALNNLGTFHEQGLGGLVKDDAKAKEYYERAAQQKNLIAQNNLRLLLEREVANDKDTPKASTLLRLGTIYYFGEGITKDVKKARGFYERAAEMNNAAAQADLGFMHQYGEGELPVNLNEAARLYGLAAAQNNAAGLNNLGTFYEQGLGGLPKDDAKAKEYYERGADQKNPSAQNNLRVLLEREVANDKDNAKATTLCRLGVIYDFGDGIARDANKAREFYERAAKMNDADAQVNLGFMHRYGEGDLPINLNEAARLYGLAAAQNNAAALNNLGNLHEQGLGGLAKDDAKAKEYYERAAEQKNPNAQKNLRLLLEREIANDKDNPKASTLLRLGAIYYNGEGITKDDKKARGFYERAAQMNDANAQTMLGHMHEFGEGGPVNKIEAAKHYGLGAAQNNAIALNNLGLCYYHGTGVNQDNNQAIKYLTLAVKQENQKAKENLKTVKSTIIRKQVDSLVNKFRNTAPEIKSEVIRGAIEELNKQLNIHFTTLKKDLFVDPGQALKSFKANCSPHIRQALTLTDKDLDWKAHLRNFFKTIANLIGSLCNTSFFKIERSSISNHTEQLEIGIKGTDFVEPELTTLPITTL